MIKSRIFLGFLAVKRNLFCLYVASFLFFTFNSFAIESCNTGTVCTLENHNSQKLVDRSEQIALCKKSLGTWKSFGNACADFCVDSAKLGSKMIRSCPAVITDSCDCGSSKCWTGKGCK